MSQMIRQAQIQMQMQVDINENEDVLYFEYLVNKEVSLNPLRRFWNFLNPLLYCIVYYAFLTN